MSEISVWGSEKSSHGPPKHHGYYLLNFTDRTKQNLWNMYAPPSVYIQWPQSQHIKHTLKLSHTNTRASSARHQLQVARHIAHHCPGGELAQVEQWLTPCQYGQHDHKNSNQIHPKASFYLWIMQGKKIKACKCVILHIKCSVSHLMSFHTWLFCSAEHRKRYSKQWL